MPKLTIVPKGPDSEKITINLGFVDLGQIELLVQEGFYSNRTDFIRTAIRNQIDRHADTVRQIVTRKSVDIGMREITSAELIAAQKAGEMLDIRVLGLGHHRSRRLARTGARDDLGTQRAWVHYTRVMASRRLSQTA